jgi:N-acetyl-anhydromuramyl-L-alanine amidase AmpD
VLVEGGRLVNVASIPGNMAHTSGAMSAVDLVVVHATVSPCKPGGARQNAAYFQTDGAGGLAHYVVDPSEVVACCPENVACWHAPPVNRRAIGVELCDPQKGLGARWGDKNHTAMLALAADLIADICRRHDVPPFYVDAAGLLAGKRGITTHHDVTLAWHKSDHVDPGPDFPMGRFIEQVHAGTPTPAQEDVVASLDEVRQVVQEELAKAVAKLHNDHLVLLRGTQDGTHPNNLDNIGKAVGVKQ